MDNIRTVSDTKRAFYSLHPRPLNSIYSRVVEELLVELHLNLVNVDFHYDPIFALGVVTAYDRFMQGYQPESDQHSIFQALIRAQEQNPDQYRGDAQRLTDLAKRLSPAELMAWLTLTVNQEDVQDIQDNLRAIANSPKFKYSRLFGIGIYSLLESSAPDIGKDENQRKQALQQLSSVLNISEDKFTRDWELYRNNLEKIAQAKIAMDDMVQAARKKREQAENAKANLAIYSSIPRPVKF